MTNSFKALMEFFSVPERPVKMPEFTTFWKSLDEDGKIYYRTVDLITGRVEV